MINIEEHFGLVHKVVNKYFKRTNLYEYDDLFQVGCVGLCKAVNIFDESRGKFSTIATHCITNELRHHFRGDKWRMGTNKLRTQGIAEVPLSIDYEREGEDGSTLENNNIFVDSFENTVTDALFVRDILKRLNDKERLVINLSYLKNKSQFEIGQILGVSQVQVSRLKTRALSKLRQAAAN